MNFFEKAIKNTAELAGGFRYGLHAFSEKKKKKIKVDDTTQLKGSVHIDVCLKKTYPNAHLWDYVFGYKGKVYYVEIHQTIAREVKRVIKKVKWLKQWRTTSAKNLENLSHLSSYHWIATDGGPIKLSQQHLNELAQNGIGPPKRVLHIRE